MIARIHSSLKDAPVRQYTVRGFDGKAFVEALGILSTLPALKDLVLRFRVNDGPFRPNTQANDYPPEVVLQFLILRSLGENIQPSPLKSLTINNILPLPHPYLSSESMIGLLSTLTHFAVNTTSYCASFPMTDPRILWPSASHLFQKEALSSSLVSLQLHHACVRSAEVVAPISEIQLPSLAYLSLQRTYFSDQSELELFISRHGGTLVELKLFLCPMALSTQITSGLRPESFRRWAQVWEQLNSDLMALKDLVVSERHDSNGVRDVRFGRYIDNCYRCNVVDLVVVDMAADDAALQRFLENVESRSQ